MLPEPARLQEHVMAAELAGVEYYDNRAEMYNQLGYPTIGHITHGSDKCSVLARDSKVRRHRGPDMGGIVVSISGTDDAADWVNNFRIARWYDRRVGWCQRGHLVGAQGLVPMIDDTIPDKRLKLTLVGHSRGGGIAVMIACMLLAAGRPKNRIEVVTFGSPRVTMEGTRKRLNGVRVSQYAHVLKNAQGNGDPVPKVMPRLPVVAPWRHVNRIALAAPDRRTSAQCHAIHEYRYSLFNLLEHAEALKVERIVSL